MRFTLIHLAFFCFYWPFSAHAGEDIVAVLNRSSATRLSQMQRASDTEASTIMLRKNFDKALRATEFKNQVDLAIIENNDVIAEALSGKTLVINAKLSTVSEEEILFILSHELGHIIMGHWAKLCDIYKTHIPGEVTPATTEPVAQVLGRQASRLAHEQEFEADGFALRNLIKMGFTVDQSKDIAEKALRLTTTPGTPTHPPTLQRVRMIRMMEL